MQIDSRNIAPGMNVWLIFIFKLNLIVEHLPSCRIFREKREYIKI